MKIGFDAKRLYNNFTGLGNYSRTLVDNLSRYAPDNEYILYTPKISEHFRTQPFLNHPTLKTFKSNSLFKSYWRTNSIKKQLRKDQIEIYHGLSNEIPVGMSKTGIKSVVSIHDLIFKKFPETYPAMDVKIYDKKFRYACEHADKIIAVSKHTKQDIVDLYHIEQEKIEVVYQSCDRVFFEDDQKGTQEFKALNLPEDYLLYVGSIEKRKNLELIIKSYKYLNESSALPLVVVGKTTSYKTEILKLISEEKVDIPILWLENLKDLNTLKAIFQNATICIYPSKYEGFGIPVLEALLSKVPVIAANTSSLPEAGGQETIYIDPNDPEELASEIRKVLSNSDLRSNMIKSGFEYAINNFFPEITTKRLLQVYRGLLT